MAQQIVTKEHYTYEDYAAWPEDFRCELIDGEIYMMSSPSEAHQTLLLDIASELRTFLKGKPCMVYIAPFDLLIEKEKDRDTVLQPDIMVVCDRSKITKQHIKGAPDMVIELLSPSSVTYDLSVKRNIYERNGVREYIAVDPMNNKLVVHKLVDGRYDIEITGEGTVSSSVLDGFSIDINLLFAGDSGDITDSGVVSDGEA